MLQVNELKLPENVDYSIFKFTKFYQVDKVESQGKGEKKKEKCSTEIQSRLLSKNRSCNLYLQVPQIDIAAKL